MTQQTLLDIYNNLGNEEYQLELFNEKIQELGGIQITWDRDSELVDQLKDFLETIGWEVFCSPATEGSSTPGIVILPNP